MTDAVLRFLVELKDEGLSVLEKGLLNVGKSASTMSTETAKAGTSVEASLNRMVAAERNAAQRSIENTAARQRSLKANAAEYRSLAATYVAGSQEQVAALLLAEKAEQRLARETAIATGQEKASYAERTAAAERYNLELSRLARGAVSRSGLLGGRALAFGSTAFLGGATVAELGRSIFSVSNIAERADQRLQTQLKASGISWQQHGAEIDKVIEKDAHFAGINNREVEGALTQNIRTTGSLRASYKLLGLETDVSAGTHKNLATSAMLVDRVFSGNLGILKRYGIVLGDNVKTPLEALIALQAKFAGQAEAQGNSTEGALEKTRSAFRAFEEGIGKGAFPVIRDELNKLTGAIDDPSLAQAGERFGHSIATNVSHAIETVVSDVRANWPIIKQDFQDAEAILKTSAHAAQELAHWLHDIVDLVPAHGSVLNVLAELYLGNKLLGKVPLLKGLAVGGRAGAAAKTAEGAAAKQAAVGTAEGAAATNPYGLAIIGIGSIVVDAVRDLKNNGKQLQQEKVLSTSSDGLTQTYAKNGRIIRSIIPAMGGPEFKVDITNTKEGAKYLAQLAQQTKAAAAAASATTGEYKRLHDEAVGTWNDVSKAIRASGGDLDADKKKLESLLKSEQDAARQQVQLLDNSFSRVTDDVNQAFDAKTQQMLDSLSYRVDVVAKGIRESFTLKGDQQTPAERELAAMDAIAQRKQERSDLQTAQHNLGDALLLGDPQAISDAQKQVDAAQLAERRTALERRATIERTAADKARARAQQELQARRDLEKRHLDDSLATLLKEAEQGKLSAGKLATEVTDELRKHGIDFKTAGDLLGAAFATQLNEDLQTSQTRANKVGDAFERIAQTKDDIKHLANEVARLAKELKKVQSATDKIQITTRIVNGVPKPSLIVTLGATKPPPKHAAGGVVDGFGSGDTVPALLTPGEIVLNRRQQEGLASWLGMPGATPDDLFGTIDRFGDGGVVKKRDRRKLLELLGIDAIENVEARKEIAKRSAAGKKIPIGLLKAADPVHIEDLVRNANLHLGRDKKLGLEQTLAQAQAHPVLSGLIAGKDPYNNPELGPAAETGNLKPLGTGELAGAMQNAVFNITVELDGEVIARNTQRHLQDHSRRGV